MTNQKKERVLAWFQSLQRNIIGVLEGLESEFSQGKAKCFQMRSWERPGGGGGTMAILEDGALFEKGGVNFSCVFGDFLPHVQAKIPGAQSDPKFWASGVSVVIHPRSPHVPIIHMNTRHIITSYGWFGGGIDLTPALPYQEDTGFFHTSLKHICDNFDPLYYKRFQEWADTYFFIPHRKEPRGVGGIFYDDLRTLSWEQDFSFTQAVGNAFSHIYTTLVKRRWQIPWGEEEKMIQMKKRGRYVEFNLIYDRGTQFGLQTNGNIDAILMSLPPQASWPVFGSENLLQC